MVENHLLRFIAAESEHRQRRRAGPGISIRVGTLSQPTRRSRLGVNHVGKRVQRRRELPRKKGWNRRSMAPRRRAASRRETRRERSPSRRYASSQGWGVNQRTGKSVEGKELAPQTGFELWTCWLTAKALDYCESPSDE